MIDPRYDYKELHTHRTSGVLLPLFSLPSPYTIGSMGATAYAFVDFLKEAKQTYWQLLPLCPTGYGNSPYSGMSSFAGNPYFIDLDMLWQEGLLTKAEINGKISNRSANAPNTVKEADNRTGIGTKTPAPMPERINYGRLYRERLPLLKKAYLRFAADSAHQDILHTFLTEQTDWLDDYALFSAIRAEFGDTAWFQWPTELRKRESQVLAAARNKLQDSFYFTVFLQYLFQYQWGKLKTYADKAGVRFIGDMPIYCAHDSSDTWAHPEVFRLNKDGSLNFVGGCPPVDFDNPEDHGQVWGMPVYDWDYLAATGFDWMLKRFKRQAYFYDVLRLDHFRGYESFWCIPFGKPARSGTWEPANGRELFSLLRHKLPALRIIAEDLGYITQEVFSLRREFGYTGMRILQHGFNPYTPNEHTPHHYDPETILYFGIHDNDPFSAWLSRLNPEEKNYFFDYFNIERDTPPHELPLQLIKAMAASIADTVIYQTQDILFLGEQARINAPGKASGNWEFRLTEEQFKRLTGTAETLAHISRLYGRAHCNEL